MNRRTFVILGAAGILAGAQPHLAAQTSSRAWRDAHSTDPLRGAYWLRSYWNAPARNLIADARFEPLLHSVFAGHEGTASPVRIGAFVNSTLASSARVQLHHNRYVVLTGCAAHCGLKRSLVWIDMKAPKRVPGEQKPMIIVASINVDGSSRRLQVLFSNDLTSRGGKVPQNFRLNLAAWLASADAKLWDGGRLTSLETAGPSGQPLKLGIRQLNVPAARCKHAVKKKNLV